MTKKSNSGHVSLIPVVSVRGVSRLHRTSERGSQLSSGTLSHFEWKGVPITWKGREQESIFNLPALVDSKYKRVGLREKGLWWRILLPVFVTEKKEGKMDVAYSLLLRLFHEKQIRDRSSGKPCRFLT